MTPPTPSQWNALLASFPNLTFGTVFITDNPTPVYNCIAYSLGYTDRWINPPQPLAPFQQLYMNNGHAVLPTGANNATIDGWGTPQNGPAITSLTHGSRTSTSSPGSTLWESKLGAEWRITHARNGLVSNVYGRQVTSFN